jgi:hypothetical protein
MGRTAQFAASSPPVHRSTIGRVTLPDDATAARLLRGLGADETDTELVLAARPRGDELEQVERSVALLEADMGGYRELDLAAPPGFAGVWPFLAVFPAVRAYHAGRGIPDDVSLDSLRGLGLALAESRRELGRRGFTKAWWLALHFRGGLYRLGRLQFNRSDDGLGIHVPADGPLDPAGVDASLARAWAFFPRHFPGERNEPLWCRSWLLDPQLADYLGEDANVVRFGRRFRLRDDLYDGDDIVRFVLGRVEGPPETWPQRTTLERAIVAHLRAGRQWHTRVGFIDRAP